MVVYESGCDAHRMPKTASRTMCFCYGMMTCRRCLTSCQRPGCTFSI